MPPFFLTVQYMENSSWWKAKHFFREDWSWETRYIVIKGKIFSVFQNETAAAASGTPDFQSSCSGIAIFPCENSRPGATVVKSDNTCFIIAPLQFEAQPENAQRIEEFFILKEKIKENGGKEAEETVEKSSSFFASVSAEISVPDLPPFARISTIDAENWSIDDVQTWLACVYAANKTPLKDGFGQLFLDNCVDGSVLLNLTEEAISEMGKTARMINEESKKKQIKKQEEPEEEETSMYEEKKDGFLPENSKKSKNKELDMVESLFKEEIKQWGAGDKKVPIKLVITEIEAFGSVWGRRLRSLISRVPTVSSFIPRYGGFHSALIVGPWYLEWNAGEIIIPEYIGTQMAIIAADIGTITVSCDNLDELASKLAEVVCEWNTKFKYHKYPILKKKENEANCQDFVDFALKKLEVVPNFTKPMKSYLDDLRKGECELVFRPSKEFCKACRIPDQKWIFTTHSELDSFVINITDVCPAVWSLFEDEMSLLKAFDRGFWVNHNLSSRFKMPDESVNAPIDFNETTIYTEDGKTQKITKHNCPFKDPTQTGTMVNGSLWK